MKNPIIFCFALLLLCITTFGCSKSPDNSSNPAAPAGSFTLTINGAPLPGLVKIPSITMPSGNPEIPPSETLLPLSISIFASVIDNLTGSSVDTPQIAWTVTKNGASNTTDGTTVLNITESSRGKNIVVSASYTKNGMIYTSNSLSYTTF